MNAPGRFIAIRFVVRWARALPWLAALCAALAAVGAGWFTTVAASLGAIVAVAAVWGLVRLGVEVVDLVAETLLPR